MIATFGCGRHSIWRTVSKGQFTCRNQVCESHSSVGKASYRVVQAQKWIRIFFLPLIPLGRDSQVVECIVCSSAFPAGLIDAQPAEAAPSPYGSSGEAALDLEADRRERLPVLKIFARREERRPVPVRLVLGAGARSIDRDAKPLGTQPLIPSEGALHGAAATPAPPQRPACTSCGICGEPRPSTAELCESCGAVFVDRAGRSCVRHRISLPTDVSCPDCGPDGTPTAAADEPSDLLASFFS